MVNMKKFLFVIWFVTASLCMLFSLSLEMMGYVSLSFNGFAVDSSNYLYVGKNDKIEVYDQNTLIRTIDPKTSRAYSFTIQDDTILLSTSVTVYEMDLDGNVLNDYEDTYTKVYNKLERNKYRFTAQDGTEYSVKHRFSRMQIVQNEDNCIYQMPLFDFVIGIIQTFATVSAVLIVVLLFAYTIVHKEKFWVRQGTFL